MRIVLSTTLIVFASMAIADEKPSTLTDKESLQGLWQAVSLEAEGVKAPIEDVRQFQLQFKGDKVVFLPKLDNREHTYEISPEAKPRAMDITPGDGQKKGKKLPCAIYELAGDKLTICIDKEGKHGKRPSAFKTKEADGLSLIVLERIKPPK